MSFALSDLMELEGGDLSVPSVMRHGLGQEIVFRGVYWCRFIDTSSDTWHVPTLHLYPVIRETPKGVWLWRDYDTPVLVIPGQTFFAHRKVKDAMLSYQLRKQRQIKIKHAQWLRAQARYKAASEVDLRKYLKELEKLK